MIFRKFFLTVLFMTLFYSLHGFASEHQEPAGNSEQSTDTGTMKMSDEFLEMLHHASPMPNLMGIVLGHADELKLDTNQLRTLQFWRDHKMRPAQKLVKKIVEIEKDLHESSLEGKPTGYLIAQTSKMLSMRMQLASQKVLCRDNMMHVLTPEQWKKVVAMYKDSERK